MSQVSFITIYPVLKISVRPARKPNSVTSLRLPSKRSTVIHLGCMLPYISSNLPGDLGGQPSNVSLFGLAPDGVYQASPVTRGTGALLPHRFTLTQLLIQWNKPSAQIHLFRSMSSWAVYSLLHFPSRHRDSTLWSVLPCGVRTFLPAFIRPATVRSSQTEI